MKEENMTSRELAVAAARLMDDQKAEDILILDMEGVCNFTSFFVIATASSSPQLRAMGGRIRRDMRDRGFRPTGIAGVDSASWLVLDYADLVIHVFSAEARDYYRLENLWRDALPVDWTESGGRGSGPGRPSS